MNPSIVGEYTEEKKVEVSEAVPRSAGPEGVSEEIARSGGPEDNETRLVHQEYMHDTSLTVGAMLQLYGASVLDFVRLECGAPDDDVKQSAVKNSDAVDSPVTPVEKNVSSLNS